MKRVCLFVYCCVVLGILSDNVEGLGVNWGAQAIHKLSPKTVVQMLKDNGIQKVKLFDADGSSLSALSGTNIEVVVAIPNGDLAAMTDYKRAQRWVERNVSRYNFNGGVNIKFYQGLLPRIATNKGTPLRPEYIEMYLFGLLDEDAKLVAPGNFERHWGIFRYDGQPKFPMDLSGQNRDIYLVAAKNAKYLENQWCMFNPNAKDLSKLGDNINYACSYADCTPLGYGSSCHGLDTSGNASYAFNAYFQTQYQNLEACDFQGLARLSTRNISTGNCNFTIQIGLADFATGGAPLGLPILAVFVAYLVI